MARPRVPDNILIHVIWIGIALILLTPFVVSPRTIFPFVVGKALYSRSLIEIVFVSWALLSLFNPSYRPPRSRMLVLLAAALGVAALSAGFGVSVQRSFWSNYERMQGVIDQAHWFALAVVLVSVVRTGQDWRILLTLNMAVSLAIALMACTEYYDYPWIYQIYVPSTTRVMTLLGNPIFLGTYLGVNITIALGFLTRSFVPVAHPGKASAPAREKRGKRSNRRNPPRQAWNARLPMLWAGRCFWGATALIGLWALTLTASRGPLLAFVLGLVALATLYVFLARTRTARLAAIGSVGLLGTVVILLLVLLFSPAVSLVDAWNVNPLLSRLADFQSLDSVLDSVRGRLSAWKAGIEGFIESPILGWGPENYIAIWGRYGFDEFIPIMSDIHDHSHNKLIEELATKGLSGLLVHAAIWGCAFHIVLCVTKDMDSRERIPVLFAGAALAGYFMQSMTAPDMAVGSLQFILLLAFVAHLETAGSNPTPIPGQGSQARQPASSFAGKLTRLAGSHGARISLAAGTIVLAGAGLFANKAIYSSAQAVNGAYISAGNPANLPDRTRIHFERAIDGFKPLANYPRRILFQYATERWEHLRARNRTEARQLLAMVDAEALAAVKSEPGNWLIQTALIQFYEAVAITDSEYRNVARRYRDSLLSLFQYEDEPEGREVEGVVGGVGK